MASTKEYLVRFSVKVTSDSPANAVDLVIDGFVEQGLRNWIWRVDDPAAPDGTDSIIGFYDGYGELVDIDKVLAEDSEDSNEDEPKTTDAEDDSELLDLAKDLNSSD